MSETKPTLYEASVRELDGDTLEGIAGEAVAAIDRLCREKSLILVGVDDYEVVHEAGKIFHRITIGCLPAGGRTASSLMAVRSALDLDTLRRMRREVFAA